MKNGDICVVKLQKKGAWSPIYSFARIIDCEPEDDQDNWIIRKVRVVGENFDRDAQDGTDDDFKSYMRVGDNRQQAAALKLANDQWGQFKAYSSQEEMRAAIMEKVT